MNAPEILLVEDNPHDERLTLRALKSQNLVSAIEVARDGQEALDFLFGEGKHAGRNLKDAPRLILLDLKLPKLDGLEVLERVKADPRTKSIPVVVMTSSSEERDLIKSYALGANSYVVKPMDFEQFSGVVRQLGMYWLLINKPPVALGAI